MRLFSLLFVVFLALWAAGTEAGESSLIRAVRSPDPHHSDRIKIKYEERGVGHRVKYKYKGYGGGQGGYGGGHGGYGGAGAGSFANSQSSSFSGPFGSFSQSSSNAGAGIGK